MQRVADGQKTLAAHGVPISDYRTFMGVEGRILVHGHDDQTGRNYLMLEGTDAKIHFIEYAPEMESLRADGGLRTNSFLRLRRLSANKQSVLVVQDLGDSDAVLKNRSLLGENARALLKHGTIPTEDGWAGWLGRYQATLASVGREIANNGKRRSASRRARNRDLSHGR